MERQLIIRCVRPNPVSQLARCDVVCSTNTGSKPIAPAAYSPCRPISAPRPASSWMSALSKRAGSPTPPRGYHCQHRLTRACRACAQPSRWTLHAAAGQWANASVATLRTTLVALPVRVARSARTVNLRFFTSRRRRRRRRRADHRPSDPRAYLIECLHRSDRHDPTHPTRARPARSRQPARDGRGGRAQGPMQQAGRERGSKRPGAQQKRRLSSTTSRQTDDPGLASGLIAVGGRASLYRAAYRSSVATCSTGAFTFCKSDSTRTPSARGQGRISAATTLGGPVTRSLLLMQAVQSYTTSYAANRPCRGRTHASP